MILDDNQTKNDEAQGETDPEWERIKDITPGLKDEPKEAPKPEEKKEPEPAKEPAKEPEALASEDGADEGEDEEDEEPKGKRPEKYIPIKQYTDEKKSWRETEAQLQQRIADLEGIAGGKEGSKLNDAAIKKYAEKHGLSVEDAKAEVERVRDILDAQGIAPNAKKEGKIDPEIAEKLQEAEVLKAEKAYEQEFSSVALPELKKLYPDASQEQIAKAKDELAKIACTKKFLEASLDTVVYASKKELDKLFEGDRRGPESSRQAPKKGPAEYTALDFKDSKTPFDELFALEPDKQSKIIEDMDVKTYEALMRHVNKTQQTPIHRPSR